MKYVFIAHSHTLCLSDIGTMEYLCLDRHDVVFLRTRNFTCDYFPKGSEVYDANAFYNDSKDAYMEPNHSKRKQLIKRLDGVVKEWVDEPFELFLPHMCDPYAMLLATQKYCRKVSFVQESAFTVEKRFEPHLSLWAKLKLYADTIRTYHTPRFYGCNWYVDGQIKHKPIQTYVLYKEYFKYLPSETNIISWPKIDCDVDIDEGGTYFIMDGYVKNGMAESDVYLAQCKDMILQFHGEKNYVKFHPNQSEDERLVIEGFFNDKNLAVSIMEQSVPFELYISNGQNLRITGMTSTLLFLAKKQGHRVTSCDSWMMESPKFKKLHDDGMPLFHEYFEDEVPTIKEL